MGYELAGAMGIKLARRDKEVICFVCDETQFSCESNCIVPTTRKRVNFAQLQ